jgi:hypothetical protein
VGDAASYYLYMNRVLVSHSLDQNTTVNFPVPLVQNYSFEFCLRILDRVLTKCSTLVLSYSNISRR